MQPTTMSISLEQRLQPQENHLTVQHSGLLQRIRTGVGARLLGLTLTLATPYLPGCGGEDCDTDKDCYNWQVCKDVCRPCTDTERYEGLCDNGSTTYETCNNICVDKDKK